jgi:hypothetical protein
MRASSLITAGLSYVGRETRCADEAVLATSPINPVRLQRVAADLGEPA